MSKKSNFEDTDIDVIISNLRGEVGEIVQTWLLMRDFYVISGQMQTDNIANDMKNQDLGKVNLIKKKFQNDLISRLSEIGIKKKYDRVNFHFAANKLNTLRTEVDEFDEFLNGNKFRDRRNEFISHKQMPRKWEKLKASTVSRI